MRGYKKIFQDLQKVLGDAEGDREIVLKITLRSGKIKDYTFTSEKTQYLSKIGMSPEDPLQAGVERFCQTFHTIMKKKAPTIVDPLGILKKQEKGKR